MISYGAILVTQSRFAALIAAGLSLIVAPTSAIAVECPDSQTVSAARLLEFKTMMMVVGLRCKSVGVIMADHSDQMASTRSTMFEEANRRVRRYLVESDQSAPVPVTPEPEVAEGTEPVATAAKPSAKIPAKARARVRGRVPAKGYRGHVRARRLWRATAAGSAPASAAAHAAHPATAGTKAPAAVPAKAPRAVLASGAPKASKPASRSRRNDPYEMYLTRVGTFYGMGDNSLDTCRKYDALVEFLADPTTSNRALTMAAERMVESTLLERQRNCAARP
jgi:hypothetical protein